MRLRVASPRRKCAEPTDWRAHNSPFALLPSHFRASRRAFTLVELLVVIAMVGLLMALLLPALAGAKADTWRAQCQSNLKQLGTGFRLYELDHNEMFPAAGFGGSAGQLAWDTYITRYIGGTAPESWATQGILPMEVSPKTEYCPTDAPGRNAKVSWVGNPPWSGLRSYATVACGPAWSTDYQVDTRNRTYPLPTIKTGVGIYWTDSSSSPPDWDAKSYRTTVVKDPGGTIALVEEPNGQDIAGNVWPCICLGPIASGSPSVLYQLDPTRPIQSPSGGTGVNQGWNTYQAHGNRFNYLFYDNHVETLTIEQTIGTGTTNAPKGMWTVATGD
jgi:prepilin-type N-terminal cleavage/methylation domain-containing protein/prepilin-type processing-associated H-X9-DG protein